MVQKKASELFQYWLDNQENFENVKISNLKKDLDVKEISFLKEKWLSYATALEPLEQFLSLFVGKKDIKVQRLTVKQIKEIIPT